MLHSSHGTPQLPRAVLRPWGHPGKQFNSFAVNPDTSRIAELDTILPHLILVSVEHYDFHGNTRSGSIVVHDDIAPLVASLFHYMHMVKFPLTGVAPIADPRLAHSDNAAMRHNISTGWNYRLKTGGSELSAHAMGYALDINPLLNILPPGAQHVPGAPGVLTHDHPVVLCAKKLGFTWGGDWTSLRDYQHFEFPRPSTP